MKSPQTIESLKNIRNLIANDELDQAFETLEAVSEQLEVAKLSNEATLLSGKFSGIRNDQNSGVLKYEDFQIEKAKIMKALLELISQTEDGSINNPIIENKPPVIPTPTPQEVVPAPPNQSVTKTLDYIFMGLIVILFITCIGGLVFTFQSKNGSIPSGIISLSGIFGCLFSMNSWRSKLGVHTVLQTTSA